jgi:hypothetical protein
MSASGRFGAVAEFGTVIVCQGPPRCDLLDDAAVAAMEAGCVWCRRITVHEDYTETVTEPTEQ